MVSTSLSLSLSLSLLYQGFGGDESSLRAEFRHPSRPKRTVRLTGHVFATLQLAGSCWLSVGNQRGVSERT